MAHNIDKYNIMYIFNQLLDDKISLDYERKLKMNIVLNKYSRLKNNIERIYNLLGCLLKEYEDDTDLFRSYDKKSSIKENDIQDYLMNEIMSGDNSIEEPVNLNKVKGLRNNSISQSNSIFIDNCIKQKNKLITDENDELTDTIPISEYMSDDKELQNFWENMETT
jgi:hypothetical protein